MDFASMIHVVSNLITGTILIFIGLIILKKNLHYRGNQSFFAFFGFIGAYFIFDALVILNSHILTRDPEIFRNLSVISILLGFAWGLLGILIIKYSEKLVFRYEIQIPFWILTIVGILLGIFGEKTGYVHNGYSEFQRNIYGWIGILVSILVYSTIIFIILGKMIYLNNNNEARKNMKRLFIGIGLIVPLLLVFEISFGILQLKEFFEHPLVHIISHAVILIGAGIIFAIFSGIFKNQTN